MRSSRFLQALFLSLALFTSSQALRAQDQHGDPHGDGQVNQAPDSHTPEHAEEEKLDVAGEIFGHVADAHSLHLFSVGHNHIEIPLPVIAYRPAHGLSIFSSSAFGHFHKEKAADGKDIARTGEFDGLYLVKGIKEELRSVDQAKVYDFSITKNVVCMLISVVILLWIMLSVAKKYKQRGTMSAPKGMQNALEPVIGFIQDEVAKPNLGYKAPRYMPLLLTVFFFIWINNMLGLLPFGFNFTGNIAVTLCLALISFIVMLASANKHFWGHLLNPPGVPLGIKFLLVPIEIISLFIKPVALTIRLFANILAGHIVILAVIMLIFIFGEALGTGVGIGFTPVSLAFAIFMFFLELLVAAIQAFIFTNLTAVFIGQAIEEAHHHDDAHDHHGEAVNEQTGQHYHVSPQEVVA